MLQLETPRATTKSWHGQINKKIKINIKKIIIAENNNGCWSQWEWLLFYVGGQEWVSLRRRPLCKDLKEEREWVLQKLGGKGFQAPETANANIQSWEHAWLSAVRKRSRRPELAGAEWILRWNQRNNRKLIHLGWALTTPGLPRWLSG